MFFADDLRISEARKELEGKDFYDFGEQTYKEHATDGRISNEILELQDVLLSYGGKSMVMIDAFDPDTLKIINRGVILDGASAYMMPGAPNQCHCNSAHLWDNNRDKTLLCTGYALSDDGLWRQHSWCIDLRKPSAVVETTESRRAYFGFGMTLDESERFLYENY